MPKRTDISSIAIIGAGPIVIGQACEFDYSGAQACKALKAEGYRVILVNSNPATIMTDPDTADATYVEPITPAVLTRILETEKPDALLPTMGGQTALNAAMDLANSGVLDRLGIELIGAKPDVIAKAEDRQLFREAMDKIGLESPRSILAESLDEAKDAMAKIGLPAIIRPSFTLGGAGGGIAYNHDAFVEIVSGGLRASPVGQVLIEESVLGWKEFEMEVVRDKADNCIIVCSIENIDPMGIHTGDSMTVAPALTLTDKEYQRMRDASIAVLREIGVDTGGSNVQFAIDPATGRQVIIEMNPRVSRSSALASKATGFPIAKIAAKLAIGYTLDELDNDITRVTPASFEPTIDYVVVKAPRFTFEKFPGAEPTLTTSMKSVGEAMSIGRTFLESLQKALRSLETGLDGLSEIKLPEAGDPPDPQAFRAALSQPRPDRLLVVGQALRAGMSVDDIYACCHIDRWFLRQIAELIETEKHLGEHGLPTSRQGWLLVKRMGFSDQRIAKLTGTNEPDVRAARIDAGVRAVFKRIDTCAAEFASETPYLYSTYEGNLFDDHSAGESEAEPTDREKIIILGGGPNRIGQGIEFDYCCVHAAFSLSEAGYETIMVNCNPETVSTDYDTSDRLYFEPLTVETVTSLYRAECVNGTVKGLIVQFGGQTPLNLATQLEQAGLPILGTSIRSIDRAEDREEFAEVLRATGLKQPANGIARTVDEAAARAAEIGYPVLIRPSFVLGGRAMEIVYDETALRRYMAEAVSVVGDNPVLIDSYLRDATEVDVDAICDGEDVFIAGIMEHIEEAGIHSGDSACALPPQNLPQDIVDGLADQARKLALALKVVGLINVQFAVKDGQIYVIEANPRASRTVPFVAKATGIPVAKIAARVMAGEKLSSFDLTEASPPHVSVKEAVFPFAKFPGVDVILGPEMKSTGEVMGIDESFARAFCKAQLGAGAKLPLEGCVFVSVKDVDKPAIVAPARRLIELGYSLVATHGTAGYLRDQGIEVGQVNKVLEGRPHVVDAMIDGRIQMVINTTEGAQAIRDSFDLRRTALTNSIPSFTTVRGAVAAVEALASLAQGQLEVAPLQSYSKWLSRH